MLFETEDDRKWHLHCLSQVFKQTGTIYPTLFTEFDGKRMAVPLEMDTVEQKNETSNMIKTAIVNGLIKDLCFAAESWISRQATDHAQLDLPVRHMPDKKECVIATFANPKEEVVYCAMIRRDKEGKPTLLPFEKWENCVSTSGRFVGMFRSAAAILN
jgi:hypothetical protein